MTVLICWHTRFRICPISAPVIAPACYLLSRLASNHQLILPRFFCFLLPSSCASIRLVLHGPPGLSPFPKRHWSHSLWWTPNISRTQTGLFSILCRSKIGDIYSYSGQRAHVMSPPRFTWPILEPVQFRKPSQLSNVGRCREQRRCNHSGHDENHSDAGKNRCARWEGRYIHKVITDNGEC